MPILRVNNCLPILHLPKRMVHIYTTGNTIHQFTIGYMINPSLHFNKIFKAQVEKCLGCYFYIRKMKTIKMFLMQKNKSIKALIIIYENNGENSKIVYIVLSCVVYTFIDNYVCIEYLSCQLKKLGAI